MVRYEFFWGSEDKCSNFYQESYTDPRMSLTFTCSEQHYMYLKAMHFTDYDMADKIMKLKDPAQIKKAGRLVQGFDEAEWNLVCVDRMIEVVKTKANNSYLGDYLLSLPNTKFVEASPYDRKWGIGLSRYDAIRTPEALWPGRNLLGKVMNYVQYDLQFWKSINE